MIRCIIVLIEIMVSYLLQSSVFPHFELAGVVPDILLILVVSTAFFKGQNAGVLAGFISGLLMDFCIGDVIGLFAILYMIIGFFTGFANKIFDEDDYLLPLALVAAGEFVYGFLYYVFKLLLQGNLNVGYFISRIIFPRMIYTTFVAILFYKLFQIVHLLLARLENKEKK